MKSIISLLCLGMLFSFNANAVYLRYCSNPGNTYTMAFGFCVNENFAEVGRTLGQDLFLRSCHNSSTQGISVLFEHCINENFSRISENLDRQIFFRYCHNYGTDEVYFGFVNCVNENFDRLEREI